MPSRRFQRCPPSRCRTANPLLRGIGSDFKGECNGSDKRFSFNIPAENSKILLDKAPENILNRVDGLLLLCFFVIFMGYTFAIASKPGTTEQAGQIAPPTIEEETEIKSLPWWKSILYIIGGLAALIFGGQLFVDGATGIARNLGVSESIIGLTLVAGGTSLPELATSIVAALKKNPEIAIGNVIGSNLFNIFFTGRRKSFGHYERGYR